MTTLLGGEEVTYTAGYTAQDYTPWLFPEHEKQGLKLDVPCVYAAGASRYFNDQTVRDQLHIETDQVWELCTRRIKYDRGLDTGSQWIYPILKEAGIRVLHYSGNTDGAVPTEGTRAWIRELNWNITSPYQPYYVKNRQIGGFVVEREGIVFATVQGVGHMAPQWYPEAGYHVYMNFLNDIPIANPEALKNEPQTVSE